jgi:hypothetical protein
MKKPEKEGILKYSTHYRHFTAIAKGIVGELTGGFHCPKGNAFIGMKIWAESAEHAGDMIRTISRRIGFVVTDKIEIFNTKPVQPPEESPKGYDIQFTPLALKLYRDLPN